jgi:hypothetical protein
MGFDQIEHKKLTSLVKMTNVFKANGTSYAYYILPTSHLQSYNLPTYQPTYLDVIPTYPPMHPPTYYLPTYFDVLPPCTYLLPYPPTYNLCTY